MSKKKIALILTVVMIITMLTMQSFAAEFPDMPNDSSRAALENAIANGLLRGIDGKIVPQGSLTRAQMATIINRAFGQ